jgi:antitoxin (DNA-binding transcriptional repressor) of toxin-antitoxin stability system
MQSDSVVKTVNMHEAKSNLSKLVQDVLDGKRVRIARHGKPVVELRLIEQVPIREPGLMRDQIWVADDFDEYSAAIKDLFEGDDTDELSH